MDRVYKVTVLMIIIDELPLEAVWRAWAEGGLLATSTSTSTSTSTTDISAQIQDEGAVQIQNNNNFNDNINKNNNSTNNNNDMYSNNPNNTSGYTSTNTVEIQFLIHAKHPERVRSEWVKQRLVTGFQCRPSWGSVALTEVMIRLLHEVLISLLRIE